MHATVCQCCGLPMRVYSAHNPNMCADCENLTFDDSPIQLATRTCAAPPDVGHSVDAIPPKVIEFTCEIIFNDDVQALPS